MAVIRVWFDISVQGGCQIFVRGAWGATCHLPQVFMISDIPVIFVHPHKGAKDPTPIELRDNTPHLSVVFSAFYCFLM